MKLTSSREKSQTATPSVHSEVAVSLRSDSIITLKEARKLLPKELRTLPDSDIEDLIYRLDSIARNFIGSGFRNTE